MIGERSVAPMMARLLTRLKIAPLVTHNGCRYMSNSESAHWSVSAVDLIAVRFGRSWAGEQIPEPVITTLTIVAGALVASWLP